MRLVNIECCKHLELAGTSSDKIHQKSALSDDQVSLQMCLELEKSHCTETDVPMSHD